MAEREYRVLSPVRYRGKTHGAGSLLPMPAADAAELLRLGRLAEADQPAEPAKKPAKGKGA